MDELNLSSAVIVTFGIEARGPVGPAGAAGGVTSVAGRAGAVTLSAGDISGLAASATTDATNAANITSGTLPSARLSGVALTASNLSDLASAASARSNLGLGAIAPLNVGAGLTNSGGNLSANVVSVAGKTGGVTIVAGDVGGLAPSATTDTTNATNISSGTLSNSRLSGVMLTANNLSDILNAVTARANLGLAALAQLGVGAGLTSVGGNLAANVTTVAGRTGAVVLAVADVTGAAPTASPALTGAPTAPTPAAADNSTKLATTAYLDRQLGANNGVATLGSDGKLSASQIPASLVGAVVYQGTWNAATNSPALVSGVGTKGWYYKVATAGATAIDGLSQWNVGDTIIFDGATWDKIDGVANEIVSVAGLTGAITGAGLKTALAIGPADISGLGYFATGTDAGNLTGTINNARLSAIPNAALANSTVTISGHALSLGAALSLAAGDVSGLAASATTDTTNATNIASGTLSNARLSGVALTANNLSDLANAATARTNLGLGPISILTVGAGLTNSAGNLAANVTSVAGRTGAITLASSDVGLGNVTNDAQTKAAVVPNTAPGAGQVLIGNAGGTAYAPLGISGDATLSSAGALTITKTSGVAFGALATLGVGAGLTSGGGNLSANVTSVAGRTGAVALAASDIPSGIVYVLAASAVESTVVTGTTARTVMSPVITVPANAMGLNGILRITAIWRFVGTNGTKLPEILFGGVTIFQPAAYSSTTLSSRAAAQIANRNNAGLQIGPGVLGTFANQTLDVLTASIDTTVAQNITFATTLGSAADSAAIESYIVELLKP